jgi:hypothetical protein
MAMATIGTVLMVIGVLALVGGMVYFGIAYRDQDQNDDGAFTNPERGQDNKDKARLGMYIGGAGLLVALVGVAFTIAGRRSSGGAA